MKILLSSNPENLLAALQSTNEPYAVVEAEYGSTEVMGSSDELTLNHHVRPERQCPCLTENWDEPFEGDIGISHFDLDTLGGVLALRGYKDFGSSSFWALAAFVDVNGAHRIAECPQYNRGLHADMAAWWSWSQAHRLLPPRDGSVIDVTDFFEDAEIELGLILAGDRYEEGVTFLAQEEVLRDLSWRDERVTENGLKIVKRVCDTFVNHLYYLNDVSPADVVVALNTKFQSCTISCSAGQINCREVVQNLWGPLAGGHPGIAGSPRGQEMTEEDLENLFRSI